jgi:dehydrodolichyl diphosphate syntase complex subunit NUS1
MDNNNLKTEQDEKASCSSTRKSKGNVFDCVAKLPELLAYCIFVVIRYILKYIILISSFLVELKKHYVNSSRTLTGRLTFNHVERDIGNLSRLPKHMSYVINEDVGTDNYCDLANLVVWTIAMGIPYISLYDRHGILKSGEARLGKIIREKVIELFGSKAKDFEIILKDSSTTYSNGVIYPKRVCIQLYSEEDGKPDILETAKRIADDYCNDRIKLDDIKVEYVDKSLRATKNIPDPELIVQFGPVSSLMGFLPWQTRLSEILHVPTHINISYSRFLSILTRFGKCQQRLGR